MASDKIRTCFILGDDGGIYLQVKNTASRWGFYLTDDDTSWDGGFGAPFASWEALDDDDRRITPEARDQLGEWLKEARSLIS